MTRLFKFFVAVLCGCMFLPACTKQEEPLEKPDDVHAFLDGRWEAVREEFFFMGKLVYERSVPPGQITYDFSYNFKESCRLEWKNSSIDAAALQVEGDKVQIEFFDPYYFFNLKRMEEDAFRVEQEPVVYTGDPDQLVKRVYVLEGGYPTYCPRDNGGLYFYKKDGKYIRFVYYGFNESEKVVNFTADSRICYFKRIK